MLKQYYKEFGIYMLLLTGTSRLLRNLKLSVNVLNRYNCYKHSIIEKYFYHNYNYLIDNNISKGKKVACTKIFIFWWQGEDQAPDIVKCCIRSIRYYNKDKEVIVLDAHNYAKYGTLPRYIIEKFLNGNISHAHFSDILRFYLIYKWGGFWMDATCLMTSPLPDYIFEYPFFSLKGPFANSLKWEWTSFFMYGERGNLIAKNMVDFYFEYWKEHDCAITYLLLDCWFTVLRNHSTEIKKIIDSLPDMGSGVFTITKHINEVYNKEKFIHYEKEFFVHKLSYKIPLLKNIDNEKTVYGYLLEKWNILKKQDG